MLRLYKLSAFVFGLLMLVAPGCRKSDNAKLPNLQRVPVPLFTVDQTMDVLIQEPDKFKGKFTVDLYFKDDVKPKSMDIVVARNEDYGNVKVYKSNVTTFPTTYEVTGQELATLFGIPITDIKPGDTFEFGSNMTLQNGTVVPMFSPVGIGYGTGITNLPNASVLATFRAVCPLDINSFVGSASVEDPKFLEATYPVTVSVEGTDVLKITGFAGDASSVLRIKIINRTQTATIAEQVFAADFFGYHNAKAVGTGVVDACDNKIAMNLAFSVDEGSFGSFTVTLVK
jgi:hypothetical protein